MRNVTRKPECQWERTLSDSPPGPDNGHPGALLDVLQSHLSKGGGVMPFFCARTSLRAGQPGIRSSRLRLMGGLALIR